MLGVPFDIVRPPWNDAGTGRVVMRLSIQYLSLIIGKWWNEGGH